MKDGVEDGRENKAMTHVPIFAEQA
jgi:hypothetical protein